MMNKYSQPRGTNDILPFESRRWQDAELKARQLFALYGYGEIRTPFFEETGLFARSLGQTSEVVQKQMLNIAPQKDAGDENSCQFSLRPEGTASVVRAYIEHNLDKNQAVTKLYYIAPMFRGERPQKGRLRQFHQMGVEAIGPKANPKLDVEIISLNVQLLQSLGLKDFKLKINSLGTFEDKEIFARFLREKLKDDIKKLPIEYQERYQKNIFRILDSKEQELKAIVDRLDLDQSYLSEESRVYFKNVQEGLRSLDISFDVAYHLVRGLDYYTHTVYEISHSSLGSQDAVSAGGRYDRLVSDLGGPDVGAVGFALGVERVLLACGNGGTDIESSVDVFIVSLGEEAAQQAFLFLNRLRKAGIAADMSYLSGSMKSQMRSANKINARYVMILGENELKEKAVSVKEMNSGSQEIFPFENIERALLGKLKSTKNTV
jgi:histidyl-tRNA synthetase